MQHKRFITVVYFFAFISIGLTMGALGPSLPSFAANTGSSLKRISSLFIFSSFGYLVGSFLAGRLLVHIRGHRLLAASLLCMATGLALMPLMGNLWLLVLAFFVIGVAQANMDIGENTLLIWLHGQDVAPYMNGLHFFFGVGSLLAPLFVAQSLQWGQSLSYGYWVMAVLIFLPFIFILRLPSPHNPSQDAGHVQRPQPGFMLVGLLIVFFFGSTGAELTFGNWLYTYSLQGNFGNALTSAYLNSAFWAFFTVSRLLGVFVSRKLSAQRMLWIDLIFSLVSLGFLMVFANSRQVFWVSSLAFGFFIATCFPAAMNLAERLGATSSRITSLFFVASSLSGMISPWVVGQWIESRGIRVLPWVVLTNLLLAILAVALISVLTRRGRQQPAF